MSKYIVFALLLSAGALGGCTAEDRSQTLIADTKCEAASTGDMYRYCLEVGPQSAGVSGDEDAPVALTAANR